jgi:hypothetical protein
MMEKLQDVHGIQDTLIETVACMLMLCIGIVIGSFFKSLLFYG